MKLFLDANVLFSGANPGSNLRRLIFQLASQHEVITSEFALEEARRNLSGKRPQWEQGLRAQMERVRVVTGCDAPVEVDLAPKDRPILATAIAERCDYLITGDLQHFGHLMGRDNKGVTVVTPLLAAEQLVG